MLPYSNKTIKNKFLIIFFFLALINSCKKKETIKSIKNVKDTIRVNCKKCIIDLSFDKTKLDLLKEKYSNNDFYIIADDANFYTSNVKDFLKQEKKEIIKIKMTSNSILKINNEFVIPYEKLNYWDFILCLNSRKPKITSPIDFIDNYHKFYNEVETKTNKSNKIENFNSSNLKYTSFFGKYHLTQNKGKIDEFSSMVIGYNIEIKRDSVFFSGQGYQTNFYDLCRAKKDKDTLKLYYNLTIDGTDYNKNKEQPLVKLYKKGKNYYVKSPIISVDTKSNMEVKFEKID